MPQESSQPWIGNHYDCSETRLLLLADQLPALPTILVKKVLADFRNTNYFMKQLSRGLAGEIKPDQNLLHRVWHRVAFTNYVERETFHRNILNNLRPQRIIVLGTEIWGKMPQVTAGDVYMTDDVQGYSLEDGSVAVCFALNNPATKRLTWKQLANTIYFALGGELPRNGRCPVGGE